MAFPASFFDVPVAPLPSRNDDTRNVVQRSNPNPVIPQNHNAAQSPNPNISPHASPAASVQKIIPPASKSFSELFTQPIITPSSYPNPNPNPSSNSGITLSAMQTGNYKGLPSVKLSKEVIDVFAQPFKYSLVGKFCHGRPSMEDTRISFAKFNLKGRYKIGQLDNRHLLIQLSTEEDYQRMFMKDVWYVNRFPMRTLAWSPSWRPEKESPIVPVWIGFPGLSIHLFNKAFLFTAASMIGTPLSLDKATAELSRPSVAKILIQVDILKKLPNEIFIDCGDAYSSFHQKVEYDNILKYCKHCSMFGHDLAGCNKVNPNGVPEKRVEKKTVNVEKQVFVKKKVDQSSGSGTKVDGVAREPEVMDVGASKIAIPKMARRGEPLVITNGDPNTKDGNGVHGIVEQISKNKEAKVGISDEVIALESQGLIGDKEVPNIADSEKEMDTILKNIDDYKVDQQDVVEKENPSDIDITCSKSPPGNIAALNLSPRGFVTDMAGSTPFGNGSKQVDDEDFITVVSKRNRARSSSPHY